MSSVWEGRCWTLCLIIRLQSRGMASTTLINLKCGIGDKFACNSFTLFKKIPVSEMRSPIVTIPLESKCFSKSEIFWIVIFLLFHITWWTTSSYESIKGCLNMDQESRHFNNWDVKMYRFWQFCMRFSVLIESSSFGFSVLDDFFYGFCGF